MRHSSVFQRFLVVIAILSSAVAAILVAQVAALRDTVVQERQMKVRELVDLGKSILAAYDSRARFENIAPDRARQLALDTIGALRWGQYADYFGVYGAGPADAGVTYAHANPKYIGVNRWSYTDGQGRHLIQDIVAAARAGGGTVAYSVPRSAGGPELLKIAYVGAYGAGDRMLAIQAGVYVDDIDDAVLRRTVWTAAVGVAGLLLAALAAFAIGRGLTGALARVCGAMDRLAAGDLCVDVPFVGRRNEVGRIARSLKLFQAALNDAASQRHAQERERERAEAEKREALSHMAETIEADTGAALVSILERTSAMSATADQMSASAERTGATARVAAASAEQAVHNAQTVAGAAEELSASIREISGRMARSTDVVSRAVATGNETRLAMEALDRQVSRIGAVADIIGEIAAKTNLLALNATIEAARAGDAGKGFAVVASEVKQLAGQTARSTAEIADQIGRVRASTAESVAAVARIEQTITEINAIAGSIALAVEKQGAATAEIARTVTETASAAHAMTGRITDVSAEAGDTSRHADSVRSGAAGLGAAMQELRFAVTRIIRGATEADDRRSSKRHRIGMACAAEIGGQDYRGAVIDLSDGGAQIRLDGGTDWPEGTRGVLRLESYRLPFEVRGGESGTVRMAFRLDDAAAAAFRGSAERWARLRAA